MLTIGGKEINLDYIPAPGSEETYWAVEKKTQFFVVIDGYGKGQVQMDPPKEGWDIEQYQRMKGLDTDGMKRYEEG